ncbi:MAG: PEP/pyruvate-binding domain-containing protein [Desulfocapsaceae bacterium]|nr:PEP/pyruvate-binding domain-containing protein [Desulfocapsaceae bacterium]
MADISLSSSSSFDPHFKVFHQLMSFKVMNILLISSAYDAFIMEEDGSIALQVIKEYQGLNLSGAPLITRVSSVEEALRKIRYQKFDLVITTPFLRGANAFDIAREIKDIAPALPVILIAHNLHSIQLPKNEWNYMSIDNIFIWTNAAELMVAMVKNVEDHVNVTMDTARAMVRVIIYVEDSPADRSLFLPLIYREVVHQTQEVLDDSLNDKHRLLRMRARPKVLMATSYEEALSLYESYKPYVFCIISDGRFSRGGKVEGEAGIRLLEYVREQSVDLPLLLLSTEVDNREKAKAIPAIFMDKRSPSMHDELQSFFREHLGFGEFVFRLPDGTEIGRAGSFSEFQKMLQEVPDESLTFHASRNHFSNWVMARAEVAMARYLNREYLASLENVEEMRRDLVKKIHTLRRMRQSGVVVRFKPDRYDPEIMDFVKIGEGAIGGKARGLAFMWARLQNVMATHPRLAEMRVTIPRTCVIAADGFENFIEENNLVYSKGASDADIEAMFLGCHLPAWLRQDLRTIVEKCRFPLSVRSSSLLEDGLFRPYAGLYETYFLHNTSDDEALRLHELENAIKLIYASTWFSSPQAFARSAGGGRKDAMAVIIQEVVGRDYDGFWYPAISGVAQSHNYYPIMNMKADEGIAHIALGMGKTVVEGEKSLRFSPAHPERIIQFTTVDDILDNSQNQFYALDVSDDAEFVRQNSNLVKRSLDDADKEEPVRLLTSTYQAAEHRIRDGYMPGMRVMTFAHILKYKSYPLPEILSDILDFGRNGMGCEVEIEFAVNHAAKAEESVFYLLQMRPMVTGGENVEVEIKKEEILGGAFI